jgi:CheY-like chemotaxis protein
VLAKRILITNEPEILRPMENSLFRRQGFSLLIASDGRQAFEIIEDHDPSLVILDLEMMTQCGDECCKRVKTDPILRKTPIILVTRADRPEDMRRCREAGCNEIVSKPIDEQELIAVACRLLNITERRKPRISMSLPAMVGRDGRQSRPGTVLNLNAGGAFVETRKLAPVDTEVVLQFSLGENGPDLRLPCRVAWVNHPEWVKALRLPVGMGLQFLEPDARTVDAIESFIESRAAAAVVPPELPPLAPGGEEYGGE